MAKGKNGKPKKGQKAAQGRTKPKYPAPRPVPVARKPKPQTAVAPAPEEDTRPTAFLDSFRDLIPAPKKMGRTKIPIDWVIVGDLLVAGADGVDIAEGMGISHALLYSRCVEELGITFSEFRRQNRAARKNILRVAQTKLALSLDKTMLIFLGKNELGQKDKVDLEHTGDAFSQMVKATSASGAPPTPPADLNAFEDEYLNTDVELASDNSSPA